MERRHTTSLDLKPLNNHVDADHRPENDTVIDISDTVLDLDVIEESNSGENIDDTNIVNGNNLNNPIAEVKDWLQNLQRIIAFTLVHLAGHADSVEATLAE